MQSLFVGKDLVATSEASAKTLSTEIEDLKSELKTAKTDMELRQNEPLGSAALQFP